MKLTKKVREGFAYAGLVALTALFLARAYDIQLGTSILPYKLIDKIPIHGEINIRPLELITNDVDMNYDSINTDSSYTSPVGVEPNGTHVDTFVN